MNCPECNYIMRLWKDDYECKNPSCKINYLRVHYKRFTVKNNFTNLKSWKQGEIPTSIFENSSKEVA